MSTTRAARGSSVGVSRPGASASGDGSADAVRRTELVDRARAAWTRHLVDLGGRNTLLWYRDLPTGTLDLTLAHPAGLAALLAGRPTRLSELIREPVALDDARRRARAIAAKSRELAEERGVVTGFLAVGMASWTVRAPDGRVSPRRPAAPVFVRACALRATGAARFDHVIDLAPEIELNPVLAHYLASEQGIEVDADALEAMAVAGPAFDTAPAFAALSDACAAIPDFGITTRLVVGTFSYAKLPMVADLANQGDTLARHDVVAALAGDAEALRAVRAGSPDPGTGDDLDHDLVVLDADGSQRGAIEAVRGGAHLVIHGPPGTGKSQTIANLIATLAADGRRVLFVAEKRAAIDAVLGRLRRVGLGDTVLDLHAGAQGRRRVARELVDGIDRMLGLGPHLEPDARDAAPRDPTALVSATTARDAAAARLREHVGALHQERQPWGVTLHEVQEAVSAFATLARPPRSRVRLRGDVLAGLDRASAATTGQRVVELASLADWSGAGAGDPWFGAAIRSPEEADEAAQRVARLAGGSIDDTAGTLVEVFRGVRLPDSPTIRDWGRVLLTVGDVRDTLEVFRPDVFDIPLGDLVAATGSAAYRRETGADLGWFERWRLRRQARALLRPGRPPRNLHTALAAASEQRLAWQQLAGSGGRPEIPADLDRARSSHQALVDDLVWLDERLAEDAEVAGHSGVAPEQAALLDLDLGELRPRVGRLAAASSRLSVAPTIRRMLDGAAAAGLGPVVRDVRDRSLTPDEVDSEVEWVWWCSVAEEIARHDARVAAHDGRGMSRAVAEFASTDRQVVDGNALRVREAVAARLDEVRRTYPEQETLLRAEAAKSRRNAPLRDLVIGCPDLVAAARPCWAMSPLVVASVLPPGRRFDVVVFDEASQIPPAEAVSAISRAGQVVVAGDPHQLPPTTFFTAVAADDAVLDGGASVPVASGTDPSPGMLTDGVESILDVLGAALPTRRLDWHYRSLDERLVAFANASVYGGSLVTFPGTGTEPVVRHVLVEGHGMVAEGQGAVETTTAEVGRVVELVLEHARARPDRSLGVICLGVVHASRIDDALRRALAAADDGPTARFFADSHPEPFFVKNLERVQGDERDDIILTIGYGKTPHGRVLHRFGPLNADGGERRLNVAVTRARRSMTVVSSIAPDDLDPARLRARGARMLRELLEYAAAGSIPGAPAPNPGAPRPGPDAVAAGPAGPATPGARAAVLVADFAHRLRDYGLVVHEQFGVSSQPLDLAVEDPARPGRLVLAIETDGPRYAEVRSVRDRDRLRAEHLERLGWRHVRVWSTDLYRDPAREVARVLDTLGVSGESGD